METKIRKIRAKSHLFAEFKCKNGDNTYLFSLLLASLYLIILRSKKCENDFAVFGLSNVVYN